jgi:hypothetical protein
MRVDAMYGLRAIVQNEPGLRDEAIEVLTAILERVEPDSEDREIVPSYLVSTLTRLEAAESIASIIRAFERELVDPWIVNWQDVRCSLDIPPEVAPHLDDYYPQRTSPLAAVLEALKATLSENEATPSLDDLDLNLPFPSEYPQWAREHTPVRRATPKVGRNEPCPCGSGKKYKRCHGQ